MMLGYSSKNACFHLYDKYSIMRASEFLPEAVSRATDIEHFKNRIKVAAKLCQGMGDHPLVFRDFVSGLGAETLLLKVQNQEGEKSRSRTKSGMGADSQAAILGLLKISNPTFCYLKPPHGTKGFHGYSHIFIPIGDHTPWWSPNVQDLGGEDVVDEKGNTVDLGRTVAGGRRPGWMAKDAGKWADTYHHAWPKQMTESELIFDCPEYYLLNLESFFNKFSGPEYKKFITGYGSRDNKVNSTFARFDPAAFTKLTSYSQIAAFLEKSLAPGGYLDWFENVLPKKKADEQRKWALYQKIEDEWKKGGGFKNPKSQKEVAQDLGIPVNSAGSPL
jgi:hypothetical protein